MSTPDDTNERGASSGADGTTTVAQLARLGARWPVGAAILLGEYLAIGLRVDALALRGRDVYGFEHLGSVAKVLVVMIAAMLVLRGKQLLEDLAATRATGMTPATWVLLAAHALCYGALYQLSVRIFDSPPDERLPGQLLATWAAVAMAVPSLALPLLVEAGQLPSLLRRLSPSLAFGAVAGGLAAALGSASTMLWSTLGHYTLDSAAWALGVLTHDVIYYPDELILGTGDFVVRLAPVCSGFEGMGLIAALLTGYISIHRRELRFPQVLLVIPAGIAAVWIANVGRIAALILIGAHGSPEVATGGFHSKAGWVLFCAIAMAVVMYVQRSAAFSQDPGHTEVDAGDPATAYLLPLLALIATSMLTGLGAAGVDYLYALRILAALAVLYALRASYRSMVVAPDWTSAGIGVLVYALWAAVVPGTSEAGDALQAQVAQLGGLSGALWVLSRVVGSTLLVPIVEELAFRGYFLRRLSSRHFESVAIDRVHFVPLLASSLAFGLLHGAWLAGTLAGVAYGLAQSRRGHTADAITAHAVTNGLVSAQVLLLGHWGLWA